MTKMTILAAALSLISIQAFASNPKSNELPSLLKSSAVLQTLKKSVSKEYGVPHCGEYEVTSYNEQDGVVNAQAVCTYEDAWGDETGVIIQVEAATWDSKKLFVQKVELVFAG
jgi:hypothetical protein